MTWAAERVEVDAQFGQLYTQVETLTRNANGLTNNDKSTRTMVRVLAKQVEELKARVDQLEQEKGILFCFLLCFESYMLLSLL